MDGIRLRQLRLQKKLTCENLAEILGTGKSTVSKWENNLLEPDNEMIKIISDFFDVSTDYLLGKTEDPRPFPVNDTRSIEERWNDPKNEFLYAMYGEVQDLTDEQKEELLNFVDYLKSKANKKNN